jgi:hypothetical protein
MADVCVAHLIRRTNGIEPVVRFFESYKRNSTGQPHDLLVIMKGFEENHVPLEYERLLAPFPHQSFFVPDTGFDISAYFVAANAFSHDYFCFLNSYSLILDNDWLQKLHRHAQKEDVGIVGATASWESTYSNVKADVHSLIEAGASVSQRLGFLIQLMKFKRYFPSFPNYHVRTNAFMLRRNLLFLVRTGNLQSKMDVYRFESGRQSLTRQLMNAGYKPLVIGKDGKAYEKEDWHKSNTFRQGDQKNLMVADNQTETYAEGDAQLKWRFSRLAWGDKAAPTFINHATTTCNTRNSANS